ncbi:PIN domain-containing protein [Rhizobium gallicum]|uniref:hypothetical protein n=1 Tax=Rhizobium gallicum TaxID=56730 RepID=UPI000AA065FD|nr:hypothetical protein [Rhizobium gallicum]TDW16868.1 hypothetical protein EV128_1316 [Rhizobium azibense]
MLSVIDAPSNSWLPATTTTGIVSAKWVANQSNSSKRRPHPKVSEWLRTQSRVAIPFAVILEVETGIAEKHLADPEKAEALWEWMDQLLDTEFEYPAPTGH